MTKVSVIIKALNEEENIARAVESALKAVAPIGGEVILADSASTDETIAIASRYPIKIVQLANPHERCCGIGPQLGFQHSKGEYVYILDGDMELDPDFLGPAIEALEKDPELAGVGGYIAEQNVSNFEFQGRVKRHKKLFPDKPTHLLMLGGGGLYRRTSLDSVGYMSDRNLHGYEEFDLGVRLHDAGWKLLCLPIDAGKHFSYKLSSLQMMRHRWSAGEFFKLGEIIPAAIESGYVHQLRKVRILRMLLGLWIYWIAAITVAWLIGDWRIALAAIVAAPFMITLLVAYRHGSLYSGFLSCIAFHVAAIGLVIGAMRRRKDPNAPIDSKILQQPVSSSLEGQPVSSSLAGKS